MRTKIQESIQIPEGVTCNLEDSNITCAKEGKSTTKEFKTPKINAELKDNTITFTCEKGNKIQYKKIKTYIAHLINIFNGLEESYTYKLEICNVHFPMQVKLEGQELSITNFLGETTTRKAKILPNVEVNIKLPEITLTSHDREAAGQTAANIEQACKIKGKDVRVFQDGIFITEKPSKRLEEKQE